MSESMTVPAFLKNSYRDVMCYSLMVGMGETYLVAFALSIGLGQTQSGLITVVPMIIGACLQLFSGHGVAYFKSRKRWICTCASLQGISLILIAQMPRWKLQNDALSFVLFGLATIYWSSALSAGPSWNIWIAKIVPHDVRLRFFSSRARVAQLFVVLGLVLTGVLLELSRETASYLQVFSWLFVTAGIFRLMSALFIYLQDERGLCAEADRPRNPHGLFQRGWDLFQQPRVLKMVGYLFVLNLAAYISSPYFNPYMLKQLQLNFFDYTILISSSFVARIVANDIFVYLAKARGVQALLSVGVIVIAPLPILWTFSDAFLYLLGLQILSGFAWGSHELGVTLVLLEKHDEKERSIILTLANLFNSTGMFAGGLIGAQILTAGSVSYESYHQVFIISTIARCAPILILFGLNLVPVKVRVRKVYMRILSVRPGGGLVSKPMLYTEESSRSRKEKLRESA